VSGLRRVLEFATEHPDIIHIILYSSTDTTPPLLQLLFIIDGNEMSIKKSLEELIPVLESETGKKVFVEILHINRLRENFDKLRYYIEKGVFLFSRKMIVRKKMKKLDEIYQYSMVVLLEDAIFNYESIVGNSYNIIPLSKRVFIVPDDELNRIRKKLESLEIEYLIIDFWAREKDIITLKELKKRLLD